MHFYVAYFLPHHACFVPTLAATIMFTIYYTGVQLQVKVLLILSKNVVWCDMCIVKWSCGQLCKHLGSN